VIETDLGEEIILLDPESQQMYGLAAAARLVWLALPADGVEPLVAAIREAYDVGAAEATADARDLLRELIAADLIRAGADDGART
jgi:hypothetical protein